jgi:capsular polysaccharide transport system permease protein
MSATPAAKIPVPRFSMIRTIVALMLREMSTTYGRTPGGYIWVILQPVGAIAVFTFVVVIGLKLRSPALGTNFPIFYATGIMPFQMFNNISGRISGAVPFSRALLFYPRVSFVDALIARFLLNMLTYLLIFSVVLGGLLSFYDAHTQVDPVPIMQGLGLALLLAAGFGVLTGYLFPVFPVLASVWSIVTSPLMLISGVLFLYDDMPLWARAVMWYNPLIHVIGIVRRGFYPMYDAAYASPAYVAGLGLVMLSLGLLLLRAHYKDIVSR